MNNELLKLSLRNNALFLSESFEKSQLNNVTINLVANIAKLGFTFSEDLLFAVNALNVSEKMNIWNLLKEIKGVNKNWTPLVKDWSVPTNESKLDHLFNYFAHVFKSKKGVNLSCGHFIPDGTFPIERYNGCPFCGTPLENFKLDLNEHKNDLEVLELWTLDDLQNHFKALLSSKVALDATLKNSLKILLKYLDLPKNIEVSMKESVMLIIDSFIEKGAIEKAQVYFKTPQDILRYLWYKHTGFLQIVEPKTILKRSLLNTDYGHNLQYHTAQILFQEKNKLKLKYDRKTCKTVATWLNNLALNADAICENMHPKRNMWVRFIRALRLAEYSKKAGFENLKIVLDKFYNKDYTVWQARVNYFRLKSDANNTFKLLKQRPGLFARSLFSNVVWFGEVETLNHFKQIVDEVPTRLLLTLSMYAPYYFNRNAKRSIKTLGGVNKRIGANQFLGLFSKEQLQNMVLAIEEFTLEELRKRYQEINVEHKKIYIENNLNYAPIPIGDRSDTLQDLASKHTGMRFPVLGKSIRLFMNWGEGLSAQHLDMDLSCMVVYENAVERCSYSQLTTDTCQHSGDVQRIPNKLGTSEYIELNIDKLQEKEAKYVSFVCNAYTKGSLEHNMIVGWMDSKFPMKISTRTGVAYDPSCVQFQTRIEQSLDKGLVFGVLDVQKREVIWLEMSFQAQVVQNLDLSNVESLLAKLDSKYSVGRLLKLMAEVNDIEITENIEEADQVYDVKWARDMANVSMLM